MTRLRQTNKEFSTYIAEFQRYAPYSGYNEVAQMFIIYNGISDELRGFLITILWRTLSLRDFIAKL